MSMSFELREPVAELTLDHSDVGCKTVANMIKGKTPEEIRKLFNIVNDFTPEEEAQIKKENVSLRFLGDSSYFSRLLFRNGLRTDERFVVAALLLSYL
jgi:hypothetical protein